MLNQLHIRLCQSVLILLTSFAILTCFVSATILITPFSFTLQLDTFFTATTTIYPIDLKGTL
jgi:hypothetical protein